MFHKNKEYILKIQSEKENEVSNFDFKLELEKMLTQNESCNDICLITKEELTDCSVKLVCGHTFNYLPLFLEIFSQKFSTNNFKPPKNVTTFICPYCRTYTGTLMPEYKKDDILFSKIYGINTYDKKYTLINTITGKNYYKESAHLEGGTCSMMCDSCKVPCRNYVKLFLGDGKCYCQKHFASMNQKYYGCKDSVGPIMLENDKISSKIATKRKKVIVDESLLCKAVLKSGKKKGEKCSCKKKNGDYCLRHTIQSEIENPETLNPETLNPETY